MVHVSVAARATAVLAGVLAAAGGARSLARGPLAVVASPLLAHGPSGLDAVPFGDALSGLCAVLLLGCVLWLLGTTLVTLTLTLTGTVAGYAGPGRAPGSSRVPTPLSLAAERCCPVLVRRLVAVALGVAVTAGSGAPPALAAAGGTDPLTGLALPERTTGAAAGTTPSVRGPAPRGTVVVRSGDSLWSISAGLLGGSPPDAATTRAWHHLYRANASRIGTDPDLILPGTRLVVPTMSVPRP
jgi:nucleoid-associated protein YgaU